MNSKAEDWGLPDWTSAASYGDTKKWKEFRWRWEFTRRREDFRADFDAFAPSTEKRYARIYAKVLAEPVKLLTRNDPGFTARTTANQIDKYGVDLLNPRISAQPNIRFRARFGGYAIAIGRGDFWDSANRYVMEVPEGTVGIRIDLNLPIWGQLEGVHESLRQMQIERHGHALQSRRHPRTWLRYLRVLDGRECGASWREIFDVVLSTEKGTNLNPIQEARRTWEGARRLMFKWPP